MSDLVDANILVRHLTGDPPDLARRATAYLTDANEIFLADLIAAEVVYVLESFYRTPRTQVAGALRSLLAFRAVVCQDPALLLRAVEVYEVERLDFAEAYLVACAEALEDDDVVIVSFDRSIDRVRSARRIEPPADQS